MTARPKDGPGDLPVALSALAAAHGTEVGALAALVLQHRDAAEAATARALVEAYRDPRLPAAGSARRLHVLRLALRRTLQMERRARAVEPHAGSTTAELLAQAVAGAEGTDKDHRITGGALRAAMASLPARLRALIVLGDLLDLHGDDLRAVAGGSPGRAARQLADAENRLRSSLENPDVLGAIEEIGDAV